MTKKEKKSKSIPRNGFALAAKMRTSGGPMKDRRTPRGGNTNTVRDLLEEAEDENDTSYVCGSCGIGQEIYTNVCSKCGKLGTLIVDEGV